MSNKSILCLHANATVNPKDWNLFTEMVLEAKTMVQKEEAGLVLVYECYFDPMICQCLIMEAYTSENAFINHLQLIKSLFEKYNMDWKIERIDLLGPYSADIIETMKREYGNKILFHYPLSLELP